MREKPKNLLKLFNAIALCNALLFLGLSSGLSFGQPLTWQRILNTDYGGVCKVLQIIDGCFITFGRDGSSNTICAYILKIDSTITA